MSVLGSAIKDGLAVGKEMLSDLLEFLTVMLALFWWLWVPALLAMVVVWLA